MTLVPVLPCEADMLAAAEYVALAFGERYRESVLNKGRWPDLVQAFARRAATARLAALEEFKRENGLC